MIAELVVAAALTTQPTTGTTTLDGVRVHLREGTQQVVTVNHAEGYHARVTFWKLTDSGWRARFSAEDGRIGYGGLVRGTKREQGTGSTPLGTYALPWAFGMEAGDDSWKLRYRQVVTVNYTDGYRARVTFWKLTGTGWQARFSADDGRIGYGGLVRGTKRQQGTGTTPLGTYGLPWVFGTDAPDPGWRCLLYTSDAADE